MDYMESCPWARLMVRFLTPAYKSSLLSAIFPTSPSTGDILSSMVFLFKNLCARAVLWRCQLGSSELFVLMMCMTMV